MSKIKVNQIEAATGSTITIPSGQTLDISSTTLTLPSTVVTTTGTQTLTNKTIGVSQLTGTLPVANGGTGLSSLGTANQVIKVNSGATGLEFGTLSAGITEADVWRVTTTFTGQNGIFNSNWERADTTGYTVLGTGMTEASGVFSFPSTGYYSIYFKTYGYTASNAYTISYLYMTLNNSSFSGVSLGADSGGSGGGNYYVSPVLFHIVKITDIVNQKVRFEYAASTNVTYENDTNNSQTQAQFIKLAGL